MPLNITVHNPQKLRNGAISSFPLLDASVASQVVALAAQSTVINGPVLVHLIPDEDQRIVLTKTVTYAAPPADGLKLKAGIGRSFELPAGAWYFNVVAG